VNGSSEIAKEFSALRLEPDEGIFVELELPNVPGIEDSRVELLKELHRIHHLGWINSKQLDSNGILKPCNAPQCGGFTLEAEFGIPKNSGSEPDYLGWEVKQYAVDDFEKIESSKPITLMTPEPSGGFYKDNTVEAFIRKFGYNDKRGREDRLNFGGRHFVGLRCAPTRLTMQLTGFDATTGKIIDANGEIALIFKHFAFKLEQRGITSRNLAFANDLLDYMHQRKLRVFGCVCFEKKLQKFQVEDVASLDKTFRYVFERVDMCLKIERPGRFGKLVFDDRDFDTNRKNSEAITRFFQRSATGLALDSVIATPFFAISQAQNIGLQLADFVTTIIGMRFQSSEDIRPFFLKLQRQMIEYVNNGGVRVSGLKVIRG
jgi:hypothetical protein